MKKTIKKMYDYAKDAAWNVQISLMLIGLIIVLVKYCYIPGGLINNPFMVACDIIAVWAVTALMVGICMLISWIVINITVRKMKH